MKLILLVVAVVLLVVIGFAWLFDDFQSDDGYNNY